MGTKQTKPTSPGRRFQSYLDFAEVTTDKPYKPLLRKLSKTGGRNNNGRITCRHRGGGHKRRYRLIDFKRNKYDIPARVETIEYDPNRSANIALVCYADGEKRYILAPVGLKVNDKIIAAEKTDIKPGNHARLKNMPLGTIVHNIEFKPGKGGQMVRSAGVGAQLMDRDAGFALLKLPSGEMRRVKEDCFATVGSVGNESHSLISLGKAGRKRWLGRRPKVRGVAMNPVDHPHGGGEGKSSGGRHPCTPWGVKTKGKKTRRKKESDKYIVTRRK